MKRFEIAAFADEASNELLGQIAAMKRNGISLLEIRNVCGKNIKAISKEEAKDIRAKLDDAGIGVWSIGSPTGKISINDEFEDHLDSFKHQIELAHILGADHYRLFSFFETDDSEGCFQKVCGRMQAFIDAAKGSGVILGHENEKGIYGDIAVRCKKLLDALPELKNIFDPANFLQCGQNTLEAWELLASYTEYMHIKDCDKNGIVVPAGTGDGNVGEILKKFIAQGGRVMTLEPHLTKFIGLSQLENGEKTKIGFAYANADEAFDAAANALHKLLQEV